MPPVPKFEESIGLEAPKHRSFELPDDSLVVDASDVAQPRNMDQVDDGLAGLAEFRKV